MCILDLSKALVYEFHYDCIKIKYGNKSRLLLTEFDSLAYEIKPKMFIKVFARIKKFLIFSNCLDKSKYYENSDKLDLR